MSINIIDILQQGEGLKVEFKSAANEFPKNTLETVCAFLNRYGGSILFGVNDNGQVVGIDPKYISKIKKELVNAINNPQLLNPPVYIIPEELQTEGKTILHLHVPESSQVHSTKGKIFDRNQDGDYNITSNTAIVANLFIRKQSIFTESKIYPYATMNELRKDLIHRSRQMAVNRQPGHAWESLDDFQLLKSVQLYSKDYSTGKEGFTLAALLLFGKDEVIQSVLPFHKTDAICRINDTDRYDDRDDIRTNLIESYDRLMLFTEKHLADKFVLQNDIRISARNLIFREVISNTIMHREYTNPFPAKFIIEKHLVKTENSNKSTGAGQLNPENFSPMPKNPVIARVFKEIGRADELGSGVRNLYKYYQYYSTRKPYLVDSDIFECSIYIDTDHDLYKQTGGQTGGQTSGQTGGQTGGQTLTDLDLTPLQVKLLDIIRQKNNSSRKEIAGMLKISPSTVQKHIEKLKAKNVIERIGPDFGGYWKING